MTAKYILIQLIGLSGTLLFFFSYQRKSNRVLFRVQFASYLIYTLHLFLLGATTGAVSYVVNMLRSFCLGSKWKTARGGHVRRPLFDAAVRACVYLVGVDVRFAGCGKHCLDDCGVYG